MREKDNAIDKPLVFSRGFVLFIVQFERLIQGCRRLISMDGTHLQGNYGGLLLSTVALDRSNELFPITYAMVDL